MKFSQKFFFFLAKRLMVDAIVIYKPIRTHPFVSKWLNVNKEILFVLCAKKKLIFFVCSFSKTDFI